MTARAATYDELKDAISRRVPRRCSPQLQRMARYALDKPHDLALGTVAAVAEANAVQPSSTIRFANALGFDGFSQMQQVFRSHLVRARRAAIASASRALRADRAGRTGGRRAAPVRRRGDRRAAPARGARRPERDWTPRCELLAAAPQIHVLAQRRAVPGRLLPRLRANQLELRATCSTAWAACCSEFARGIGNVEVLLVASFRNYTPEVVEIARARHAPRRLGRRHHRQRASPLMPCRRRCFELGDDRRGRSARWSSRSAWRSRWWSALGHRLAAPASGDEGGRRGAATGAA